MLWLDPAGGSAAQSFTRSLHSQWDEVENQKKREIELVGRDNTIS